MKVRLLIFIFLLGIFTIPSTAFAQEDEPQDDLGNVTDEYQELFFEALKQKAI